MKHNSSSKGIILDICAMRSRAHKFKTLNRDPEYIALLDVITAQDYYNDEDLSIPTLKDLASSAEMNYYTARKYLNIIYDDLCSHEFQENIPFQFEEVIIRFGLNGYLNSATLRMTDLKFMPRIGENIQLHFFKELTGCEYFHVDKIYHEFNDDLHEIFISLEPGSYNRYWKLRKDQAEETREISAYEAVMKKENELKKVLNLRPGKAW